jgi:hypothetical protein
MSSGGEGDGERDVERSRRQSTDRQRGPVSIVFLSRLTRAVPRSSVIMSRSCSKLLGTFIAGAGCTSGSALRAVATSTEHGLTALARRGEQSSRLPPNDRVRSSSQYWLSDAHLGPTSQHRSLRSSTPPNQPFHHGRCWPGWWRAMQIAAGAERRTPSVCPTPLATRVRRSGCCVLTDTVRAVYTANDSQNDMQSMPTN